ncbi:MAG TPA: YdhR family protein [Ferruginibacter sp.]|jgi:hypothetical protein|nr:YdhR family protein [Ferruginibacter sp.]
MTQYMLITRYNYKLHPKELETMQAAVADRFANIPGCQWKIWLLDETKKEAGAVYLFDGKPALESFRNGRLFGSVLTNPAFANFDMRMYAIAEKPSVITNAPLKHFEFFF